MKNTPIQSIGWSILTTGLSLGVIVVDQEGRILHWNQWMEQYAGILEADILAQNIFERYPEIQTRHKDRYIRDCMTKHRPVFLSSLFHQYLLPIEVVTERGKMTMLQNVKIYPVFEPRQDASAVIIIENVTESISHEQEIQRLNRLLKRLRDINRLITKAEAEEDLFSGACALLGQQTGYHCVWFGLLDEERSALRPAAFPDAGEPCTDILPFGMDIARTAVSTGSIQLFTRNNHELRDDGQNRAWKTLSERSGYISGCVLPLKINGRAIGALSAYSRNQQIFYPEEIQLLAEMGDDISFGIHALRERQERIRADQALKEYAERLEEMVDERTRELRDAQEQLVQQERLTVLGQLAGGVAHELRNPLGAIKNSVYFLKMVLEEPEQRIAEMLQILESEIENTNTIINSLLDVARPKAPNLRRTDLSQLLWSVLSRQSIPDSIQVDTQFDALLPPVSIDPDQCKIVFGNLIRNAVQAMSPPSTESTEDVQAERLLIHMTMVAATTSMPESVAISFSDTGRGIVKENVEKVFQPLFTTRAKGIGLGLALVKILVEGHNGTISVRSEPGKGSVFTVTLPLNHALEH